MYIYIYIYNTHLSDGAFQRAVAFPPDLDLGQDVCHMFPYMYMYIYIYIYIYMYIMLYI